MQTRNTQYFQIEKVFHKANRYELRKKAEMEIWIKMTHGDKAATNGLAKSQETASEKWIPAYAAHDKL